MSGLGSPRPVTSRGRSARRRLSRRVLSGRILGAALLALPVAELALLIVVGRAVGVAGTLLLLASGAVAGVVVLRRTGAAAAQRVLRQPGEGPAVIGSAPPGTALLIPAGLLLIVPGFLSDIAGLTLLVPAVRRGIAARLGEAVTRRLSVRAVRIVPGEVISGPATGDGSQPHGPGGPVEVRVTDVRPIEPPHPGKGGSRA